MDRNPRQSAPLRNQHLFGARQDVEVLGILVAVHRHHHPRLHDTPDHTCLTTGAEYFHGGTEYIKRRSGCDGGQVAKQCA
ncbi:hypothetical protein MTOK_53870 [Mycolicibacterium tokaiense]|nr:hypothetical protein MTOK_53870 [Mycolicibacterium tokaiense]